VVYETAAVNYLTRAGKSSQTAKQQTLRGLSLNCAVCGTQRSEEGKICFVTLAPYALFTGKRFSYKEVFFFQQ